MFVLSFFQKDQNQKHENSRFTKEIRVKDEDRNEEKKIVTN